LVVVVAEMLLQLVVEQAVVRVVTLLVGLIFQTQ
jgi:hypothetical protein